MRWVEVTAVLCRNPFVFDAKLAEQSHLQSRMPLPTCLLDDSHARSSRPVTARFHDPALLLAIMLMAVFVIGGRG